MVWLSFDRLQPAPSSEARDYWEASIPAPRSQESQDNDLGTLVVIREQYDLKVKIRLLKDGRLLDEVELVPGESRELGGCLRLKYYH